MQCRTAPQIRRVGALSLYTEERERERIEIEIERVQKDTRAADPGLQGRLENTNIHEMT